MWAGEGWECHCCCSSDWACDPGHVFPVTAHSLWVLVGAQIPKHWSPLSWVRLLRPVSGPALAEAELLTHSQHADTGPGVSLGRTQASPSGHPPIVMMGQLTVSELGRVTVESSIVKPVLVMFLWKSLTRYCYLSHCPWFADCVNSLISWHRHNTMTTIRGRVTCDFRK